MSALARPGIASVVMRSETMASPTVSGLRLLADWRGNDQTIPVKSKEDLYQCLVMVEVVPSQTEIRGGTVPPD